MVMVYKHCNYWGYGVPLSVGAYPLSKLRELGVRDNDISSIRVPDGFRVYYFSDNNYSGSRLGSTSSDMKCDIYVDDDISSLWVARRSDDEGNAVTDLSDRTPRADNNMVFVKGGCFEMGDTFGDVDGEVEAVHEVCLDDFYINETEVTQEAYKNLTGKNPSLMVLSKTYRDCPDCPVDDVTWHDAKDYCEKTGMRLPTEAEWEYAARSGGKKERFAGTSESPDAYAWFKHATRGQPLYIKTYPAGLKKPNGLGLYDMSGNVAEWVSDWYDESYYNSSPPNNPTGPASGKARVVRDGHADKYLMHLRASRRTGRRPNSDNKGLGFRCAKSLNPSPTAQEESSAPAPMPAEPPASVEKESSKQESGAIVPPAAPSRVKNEMVLVKGGCFEMGDIIGGGKSEEHPVHEVCLDDFSINETEVTQRAYRELTGKSPSEFKGCDDCPVEKVNWHDAKAYCEKSGKRLPTEAEWEYAARSGGGKDKYAGTSGSPDAYAWYKENSGKKTHTVKQKKPNELGLYDMSGNVMEWVSDWYDKSYYNSSPRNNPTGPASGKNRVLRGGSWFGDSNYLRTSRRYRVGPKAGGSSFGFRCAGTP
jgi:formylglycine-generating enzyme required for sulfatase activity